MKRKIICYLFLVSVIVNLFPIHATKSKKNSCQPPLPSPDAIGNQTNKPGRKKRTRSSLGVVPTYQEIIATSYQRALSEMISTSRKRHRKPTLRKKPGPTKFRKTKSEPGNVELLGSYRTQKTLSQMESATQSTSPIQLEYVPQATSGIPLKIGFNTGTSELPSVNLEPQNVSAVTSLYRHDAYVSLRNFTDRWIEFSKYFEKLIKSTHFIKYFGPDSQLLTQSANETIRKFMKPSEYLDEVERIFLSEDTFNSQIASEIISKKLSELGLENYIIEFTPGNFDHLGVPESINKSRWVVLYRGAHNNWYVVDFSLAMEYKFDVSVPLSKAATIPFSQYMKQLLDLANNQDDEWFTNVGYHTLRNVVMINFTPGFYEQSDCYYMSEISYLPFDYFVSIKLEIEQDQGLDQYIGEIKTWMDEIRCKPNYRMAEKSPETIQEMSKYMMNYLVFTE